jgi:hypothetical protein
MMATLPGGADIPGGTAHVALIVCLPLVEMDDSRMERANSPDQKRTADLWITQRQRTKVGTDSDWWPVAGGVDGKFAEAGARRRENR